MEAANAYTVHPFYILADSVFTDIAVHPMPPDQRPGSLRGIIENFPKASGDGVVRHRRRA